MTKKINTTVAELTAGSAERTIEDRGGPNAQDVNTDLVQASGQTDADLVVQLFGKVDDLTIDEHEYQDVETGEVRTVNRRHFWKRILMGGIVRNVDFLIDKQREQVTKAERAVDAVARGKTADEDGALLARREAWAERETERLLELVAIRNAAATEYATAVGEAYGTAPKKAPPASGSAAARKAAVAAALAAVG